MNINSKTLKLFSGFTVTFAEDPVSGDIEYILRDNGNIVSKTYNRSSILVQKNINERNIGDVYGLTEKLLDHNLSGLVLMCREREESLLFKDALQFACNL